MRPPFAAIFVAALAVGCGGSGDGTSTASAFFRIAARTPYYQSVSGGWDAQGNPTVVIYDERTEVAQVRTLRGTRSFSLKGRHVAFNLWVQDGFADFYTIDDTTSGEVWMNVETGAVYPTDILLTTDGDRFIGQDEAGHYSFGRFGGDAAAPLAVPLGKSIAVLAGDYVMLKKDEGEIPGFPMWHLGARAKKRSVPAKRVGGGTGPNMHYFSSSRLSLSTGSVVEYAVPEGMLYSDVVSISDSGEAAGVAYPSLNFDNPVLVRWDREGVPTILASLASGYSQITIANSGRIFYRSSEDEPMRLFEEGQNRSLSINVPLGAEFTVARDGRTMMVEDGSVSSIAFYRVP